MFDNMDEILAWEFDIDIERKGAFELARSAPDALILSVYQWKTYLMKRRKWPRRWMAVLGYGVRAKGGRPPYDPVTMFKVLVLASMHNPGDERMEFLIRDRLSWLRFPGFQIGEPTPDQKTIWLFREKLTRSGAFKSLFAAFENQLCERDYKPTGGQIVDATLVSAPRAFGLILISEKSLAS